VSSDDLFQRLDRDVARIDVLMGQLLTLSRLETGLSSAEKEAVDLAQLVEAIAADGNFEAQACGKSVTCFATDRLILESADLHALQGACENVIRNAVRFTPRGTDVEVHLRMDQSTPEPRAILSVRDHGPGVPEDALGKIFQPFFRMSADGDTPPGNGLGLAIAFEAIRLHHGVIRAANVQPTGLEVTVELPVATNLSGN
jgi:signal transduction histidine kinase